MAEAVRAGRLYHTVYAREASRRPVRLRHVSDAESCTISCVRTSISQFVAHHCNFLNAELLVIITF